MRSQADATRSRRCLWPSPSRNTLGAFQPSLLRTQVRPTSSLVLESLSLAPHPLNSIEVAKQAEVQQQAEGAGRECGPNDRLIAAEVCVHRCGEQPQLKDHEDQDEGEHAVDHGCALLASERPFDTH